MTSKKRTQKLRSILMTYVSLPRSGLWFWLVEANFRRGTSNQKHYPDLCIHMSSVSNFYVRSSEVLSRANQCWHREMLVVFSGCSSDPYLRHGIFYILLTINVSSCIFSQAHSRKCLPSLRPLAGWSEQTDDISDYQAQPRNIKHFETS